VSEFDELILDGLVTLGYPTVREMHEFLSSRDPFFVDLTWPRVSWVIERDGPATLGRFEVSVRYARVRLFNLRPPIRREPSVMLWPKGRREDLEKALVNGPRLRRFRDVTIVEDQSRPVWYLVSQNHLIGVYDARHSVFRLPSVRTRGELPVGPAGTGWSETAYASHAQFDDYETFLSVSVC